MIVINNNELGKITKEQKAGGWDKWATDLVNPDFSGFATGAGGLGLKVSDTEQLDNNMKQLFEHKGPALLEIASDVRLI